MLVTHRCLHQTAGAVAQGMCITGVQLLMTATSWVNESKEGGATPYSKFAPKGEFHSWASPKSIFARPGLVVF